MGGALRPDNGLPIAFRVGVASPRPPSRAKEHHEGSAGSEEDPVDAGPAKRSELDMGNLEGGVCCSGHTSFRPTLIGLTQSLVSSFARSKAR